MLKVPRAADSPSTLAVRSLGLSKGTIEAASGIEAGADMAAPAAAKLAGPARAAADGP